MRFSFESYFWKIKISIFIQTSNLTMNVDAACPFTGIKVASFVRLLDNKMRVLVFICVCLCVCMCMGVYHELFRRVISSRRKASLVFHIKYSINRETLHWAALQCCFAFGHF